MLEELIFEPKVWLLAGIVLIVADMLLGAANFLLAVGVAALLLAGILFGQSRAWIGEFETWRGLAIAFAVLSLASVSVLRLAAYGRKKFDVNRY